MIADYGRGEIARGALQAGLDIENRQSSTSFAWEGFEETKEVSGDGSVELLDDGSPITTATKPSSTPSQTLS
jgi:hypothetical protein